MNRKTTIGLAFIIICLLAACGGEIPADGTYAWIDAPVHDVTVPVGQVITIDGHASSVGGISLVEIWIDGELFVSHENLDVDGNLVHFEHIWVPAAPGDYTIQVIAFSADSASSPDSVTVHVGEESPVVAVLITPTPVITETPTPTPTLVPPPDACFPNLTAIQNSNCRFGPGTVYDIVGYLLSGESAEIAGKNEDSSFWLIENPDSPGYCWIWDELVETECDTSEVKVVAAPPTPTPVMDTTPPPIPSLSSPANGADLGCLSFTDLSWTAVSDPSGIAGYKVEVQRHPGDNNWQPIPGSPMGATGTTQNISVECGYTYRWQVRAIDDAGNQSDWSGWFTFNVPLI